MDPSMNTTKKTFILINHFHPVRFVYKPLTTTYQRQSPRVWDTERQQGRGGGETVCLGQVVRLIVGPDVGRPEAVPHGTLLNIDVPVGDPVSAVRAAVGLDFPPRLTDDAGLAQWHLCRL